MIDPEKDPLRLDRQVCFPLYAASNLLTRLYRPVLSGLGLTYPQYLVMLVLWEETPHSVGSLGEKLYLDSGTLTPLLKRMEQAGLISRSRDPSDERRVLIDLTPAGRALRAAAEHVPATLMAGFGPAPGGLDTLRDSIRALVAALNAHVAGGPVAGGPAAGGPAAGAAGRGDLPAADPADG
ncbi:organic hydroperoxide resistance transcriptionalregulator [Rhodospirillum centenum SW]|uniref:Organic hydroperoxide resistance transcriptionalregulator n=1 Tax=Rhodospirillum centenum (strain ATCC 51521 / SW) TaxID=414684 RepID=B6IS27_RHOCS|nr:MarR family transcriptional regulator [Rhodospirillum centenum]ACI98263.1 organic hydroperoxide resistance transcriptionalregulator [Rhodospirillum centenum SW]